MLVLFWLSIIILSLLSLVFLLPFIMNYRVNKNTQEVSNLPVFVNALTLPLVLSVIIILSSFCLYQQLGYARHLKHYYSDREIANRTKGESVRQLMLTLEKKQFLLELRLKENPKDAEVERHLLAVLGIRNFYNRQYTKAKRYLEEAYHRIPEGPSYREEREKTELFLLKLEHVN